MSILMVSYDISDTKLRTRFSKFLEEYGDRVQYSVFELKSSPRLLALITSKIEGDFGRQFTPRDSVLLFQTDDSKTVKYGHAAHQDESFLYIE